MTTTSPAERRLEVAGLGEILTFLEVASDNGGARTLVEVELAPGSGNPLHTHATFDETFEVLDGTLTVVRDGKTLTLGPGDVAHVAIGVPHRFANDSAARCCFRCAIEPASAGFERAQQVGFGLARDGKVTKKGMPRDPRHLGLMLAWMDTAFAGPERHVLGPLSRALAWVARRTGEDRRLIERYVRF
jgi:quercetin dioxygenase-like cupin family protein